MHQNQAATSKNPFDPFFCSIQGTNPQKHKQHEMSNARVSEFNTCTDKTRQARENANISTAFEYDTKMTSADACQVKTWLSKQGIRTSTQLLSREGMSIASKIMCRWPRPSELSMMTGCMNSSDRRGSLKYYRKTIRVSAPTRACFAKLVGKLGINFTKIGEAHNLMYMWLHKANSKAGDQQMIVMYAQDPADFSGAHMKIDGLLLKSGVRTVGVASPDVRELSLTNRSKDFGEDLKAHALSQVHSSVRSSSTRSSSA